MSGCDHRHLLVVGAQRCGTTYLSRALDAHPDVTMARPSPPEPKVFCDAVLSARGVESYHRTWFAHARDEELLGDKSTSYLEDALLADLDDDRQWDPPRSSVSPFAYLRRGRYAEQLEPWSATFPSTTHVLLTEELLDDPAVLTGLVADLGLDPGRAPVPDREVVNATPGVEPVLDAGVTSTLEGYFEESNARLADQLGRPLPW